MCMYARIYMYIYILIYTCMSIFTYTCVYLEKQCYRVLYQKPLSLNLL